MFKRFVISVWIFEKMFLVFFFNNFVLFVLVVVLVVWLC